MLKHILKDNHGSISLLTVITLSVLLPILLFVFVEFTNLMTLKDKYKLYNENIANTVIASINEDKLKNGIIEIDQEEAEEIANKMLIASYNLNNDLTLKDESLLKSIPTLKVYIINETNTEGVNFTTDEGYSYTIYKPSVIIYTCVEPKGVLFDKMAKIKSCTVSQLQFNEVNLPTINNSIDIESDMNFFVEKAINPYRFNFYNPFTEFKWGFEKIPMSAGTNFSIATNFNIGTFTVETVFATVNINGDGFSMTEIIPLVESGDGVVMSIRYRGTIFIPGNVPNNSIIKINVEATGTDTITGIIETKNFPAQNAEAEIGIVENNIKELLRINKTN